MEIPFVVLAPNVVINCTEEIVASNVTLGTDSLCLLCLRYPNKVRGNFCI